MEPTPVPAASPAVSRATPSAAVDPFGIADSNGTAPTGGSSQSTWSAFGSNESSSSQALQPGAATNPASYTPEGAPAWSAFNAPTHGAAQRQGVPPSGAQPVGGVPQQPTPGSQQPVAGASWDPFSASGPPTGALQQGQNPAGQQPSAGLQPQPQPTQAPPTPPQPTLQQAVLMAEQRAQQQAASQRQPQQAPAGGAAPWQSFGNPTAGVGGAHGAPGPQASAGVSPTGSASMKELPLVSQNYQESILSSLSRAVGFK